MTIVETRVITGGVDTHLDVHVAAALDAIGGVLGIESFPTTTAGYQQLFTWLSGFGELVRVGVEGTGAYGAGLARFLHAAGIEVIEVDRPNRQARRRQGKSDPLDAVEAARAALSGRSLQEYVRSQLIELARRPDPEVLLARVRDRKQRIGSRLSAESILGHRDADRR